MKARSGLLCFRQEPEAMLSLKKRCRVGEHDVDDQKRARASLPLELGRDFFNGLPQDLILLILAKLSSSANKPSDLINVILTCRSLKQLATLPMVLSKVSKNGLGLKAKRWSNWAHRFLIRCVKAGNLEACYTLGMIYFYCLKNRMNGLSLLKKAVKDCHPEALYSLAIIRFNGSGGHHSSKDLRAGAKLCARAAFCGHIDALRELGLCFSDGYGVHQNVAKGRRLLINANVRELAAVIGNGMEGFSIYSLYSDFGCNVPMPEAHPANRFMVEWFNAKDGSMIGGDGVGLKMCSQGGCGRPETRRHEFRCCSLCWVVRYCSRACQALHWKHAHMAECSPMVWWMRLMPQDHWGRQVIF